MSKERITRRAYRAYCCAPFVLWGLMWACFYMVPTGLHGLPIASFRTLFWMIHGILCLLVGGTFFVCYVVDPDKDLEIIDPPTKKPPAEEEV